MKRVIYIYPVKASFVELDLRELRKEVELVPVHFDISQKWLVPFRMLRLFIFLMFSRADVFLVNFGGYHSYVATKVAALRRIPCYIILNGIDAANIPEMGYGYLRGGLLRRLCLASYRAATSLLPVSQSLIETENAYLFEPPRKLGLNAESGVRINSYDVIPNGFDVAFWQQEGGKEANSYVTVIGSERRAVLKGLDLILELAKDRPDWTFYVVGLNSFSGAPANVHFTGYLDAGELRSHYAKSMYYLQLSAWEGFGCALCEAMLSGCIPIVSNVNALPEIVGDTSYILKKKNKKDLVRLIDQLDDPEKRAAKARQNILENYPIERRIKSLMDLINSDHG